MTTIERMPLREYSLRMKAFALKRVDEERDMYMQAWLNQDAGSMVEKGNKQAPKYKEFKEFFNYQERINHIIRPKNKISDKQKKLARIAMLANQKGG